MRNIEESVLRCVENLQSGFEAIQEAWLLRLRQEGLTEENYFELSVALGARYEALSKPGGSASALNIALKRLGAAIEKVRSLPIEDPRPLVARVIHIEKSLQRHETLGQEIREALAPNGITPEAEAIIRGINKDIDGVLDLLKGDAVVEDFKHKIKSLFARGKRG